MKEVTDVTFVLYHPGTRSVVIQYRIPKDPVKGCRYAYRDCLPGGGIKPGETPLDTVRREVKAETGILVTHVDDKPITTYAHDHRAVDGVEKFDEDAVYFVEVTGGTELEHGEGHMRWVPFNELLTMDLAFEEALIVQAVVEHIRERYGTA